MTGRRGIAVLSALLAGLVGTAVLPALPGLAAVTDEAFIVTFAAGTSEADQQAALAAGGATDASAIPVLRMHSVTVASDSAASVVEALRADPSVTAVEADHTRDAEAAPDDPAYPDQWALPQIGWDQAYGAVPVEGHATVAVLDTGVDASQTDLAGVVLPGHSVLDGSDGTTDPNGHGTAMAGIVAARTGNGEGVAGVAYAGVDVLPVTVLRADGTGQDSDIIDGVVWAADHGADVILMSFSNPGYSPALQAALDYAWSKGAVLVAATGNDASTTATFPAGDRGVVGVSNTTQDDSLNPSSNHGDDTFLGAPGTSIVTTSSAGGTETVTGTSASAAVVAGAAALVRAHDSTASNGVVVGRLARTADPAGTAADTGNGRVDLARALGDTSTDVVEPSGAAPVGSGGPLVGPYVADAAFNATLQGQDKGSSTWKSSALSGYSELDSIPLRVALQNTNNNAVVQTIAVDFDHTQGGTTPGIQDLTSFTASAGVSITSAPVLSSPAGDKWTYTFTISIAANTTSDVHFTGRLAAGAHLSTGNSMSLGGTPSLGTLPINKPAAVAGSPDLTVSKSGPSTTSPGSTVTYTLNYSNKAGAASNAIGSQLTDTLPAGVTYVTGSCTGCSVTGNTVTWDLGTLPPGTTGSKTLRVTVPAGAAFGTSYTDTAEVLSAQNDANSADNTSSLTTTVAFNRAPVANGDSYSTAEDTALTVAAPGVLGNDADADGNALTAAVVSGPGHGALTLNANGSFTYTPAADYNGADSFTYKANDGSLDSGSATVSLTVTPVNDRPTATSSAVTVQRDSSANPVALSASDLETAAGALTYTVTSGPSHGSLSGSGSSRTYTPAPGYSGSDSFSWTATDTGDPAGCSGGAPACSAALTSSPATVSITVAQKDTTTSGVDAQVTYGASSVSLSATVSSTTTVNAGSVRFTVYDGADVVGTATTVAVSGGAAAASYALPAGQHAGPYQIQVDYLPAGGFGSSSDSSHVLTVNKASVIVTASSASRPYGAVNPAVTGTVTGFLNGETYATSGFTGAPTCGTTATTASNVGSYPTSCTIGTLVSTNYVVTGFVPGAFSVTQAALTLVADDASRAYGAADSALTFHADPAHPFVNGDTAAGLTTQPTLTTTATASSPVGTYAISISGAAASNYVIRYTNGTLTVGKVALTVTADPSTKAYGTANPAFSVSYSGFVNGDGAGSLGGTLAFSTAATGASPVGSYPVTPSGLTSANYTMSFVAGTLTVTPATLVVTAVSAPKVYGAALPALGASITGYVNGDDATSAGLSGSVSCSTTATAASPVGSYPITCTAGTLSAHDYVFTTVPGTLSVTKAALTLVADDASRGYGSDNPALTFHADPEHPFVNADSAASLTTPPTLSTPATASSPVGTYPVSIGGAAADNYSISYVAGTLTVGQVPLTVTADPSTKVYGTVNPAFSVSYSGFVDGDGPASLGGTLAFGTAADATSLVGGYSVTPSGLTSPNYAITFVAGTLTVTKAPLSITVSDRAATYGDPLPANAVTYSGFVNGDGPGSLSGTLAYAYSPALPKDVGPYPISASGLTSTDYDITFHAGSLSIGKATLTVTADDTTMTYGGTVPALTATVSGYRYGETLATSGVTGTPSCGTSANSASVPAQYAITCGIGTLAAGNYDFSFVVGVLTVQKGALTVTVDHSTKVYGDANPAFTVSYSGFVNSDDATGLGGSLAFSTGATPASVVGGYPVSAAGLTSTKYSISYIAGTLTVTKAPLTITASNTSKVYGGANPALTGTISGLRNEDEITASYSTVADETSHVGDYAIVPAAVDSTPGTLVNYDVTLTNGTLKVTKAPLTITADGRTKTYGDALTLGTSAFTATGLVNGDTVDAVTLSSSGAAATAASGTYPVAPSAATGTRLANYTVTYVDGLLTVHQAPLTITAGPTSKVYGDANPSLTGTVVGLRNGDGITASYSTAATPASVVGGYDIVPSAVDSIPGTLSNYDVTLVNGTLTVTQAPLTVTAADKARFYGDPNPALTGTLAGVKNSDPITATYATVAVPASPVGAFAIVPSLQDPAGKLGNYDVTSTNGTLTVCKAPLTITAADKSKVYGDANPALTGTITGIKNADGVSASYSTLADAVSPVGTYAILPAAVDSSPATLSNYTLNLVNGTLTVNQKALTVTASNRTKTYGDTLTLGTSAFTASGLVNGDTVTGVTLASAGSAATAGVGSYDVVPSAPVGSGLGNYAISYAKGTLVVSQKALTVTAKDWSKTYGATLALGTTAFSTAGLVNADTVTGVTLTSAGAAPGTQVGSYDVVPSAAVGSGLGNYAITYAKGTLVVNQKALSITAGNQSKTYGDTPALGTTMFSTTGLVNGDTVTGVTLTSAGAASSAGAGTYDIVASNAVGTGLGNYTISYAKGTLTVNSAVLTVTADDQTVQYSDATPALTYKLSGFRNGETAPSVVTGSAVCTSTRVQNESPAGTYPISCALGALSATNYTFLAANGTLTVTREDATLEYTGDTLVATSSTASNSTATVNLAAVVREAQDGALGNKLGGQTVRIDLYKSNNSTMVTADYTCLVTMTASSAGAGTGPSCSVSPVADNYTVKLTLLSNGFYTAPCETYALTVVNPGTGFTTGGGWLNETNLGSRSNFGFTVKYLKNSNIQGNSLYIYRKTFAAPTVVNGVGLPAGAYNWIIKSNAMSALTQSCTTTTPKVCTATFTGKNNITAVNRATGLAYGLGGNYQFQVDVTDNSEPGSSPGAGPDTYAIKVWDATGTYYQFGTPTGQVKIDGGNIQVRP